MQNGRLYFDVFEESFFIHALFELDNQMSCSGNIQKSCFITSHKPLNISRRRIRLWLCSTARLLKRSILRSSKSANSCSICKWSRRLQSAPGAKVANMSTSLFESKSSCSTDPNRANSLMRQRRQNSEICFLGMSIFRLIIVSIFQTRPGRIMILSGEIWRRFFYIFYKAGRAFLIPFSEKLSNMGLSSWF